MYAFKEIGGSKKLNGSFFFLDIWLFDRVHKIEYDLEDLSSYRITLNRRCIIGEILGNFIEFLAPKRQYVSTGSEGFLAHKKYNIRGFGRCILTQIN